MKKNRFLAVLPAVLSAVLILSGCGGKAEHWAYNHEPDKEVLTLYDNGKAVFEGNEYKYTRSDGVISMTGKDGSVTSHKYEADGDKMIFYNPSVYTREGKGEGVRGKWIHDNGRNLFEFSANGQFNEDNYFYGHYTVNEKDGTIKLMYVDPLQDTLLYYSLDGDKITIEYPWPMVQVGAQTSEKGQTTIPSSEGK